MTLTHVDAGTEAQDPPPESTIMIVDDHELIAQGLSLALRGEGIRVVQERTPDPAAVVPVARWHRVTLALVDLQFTSEEADGLALIRPLTDAGIRVLVLTASTDDAVFGQCLEAGAVGVLSKAAPFDSLLAGIDAARQGGAVNSPRDREDMLSAATRRRQETEARTAPFRGLTPRESEVLCYLARGFTADAIAEATFVSVATVRTHISAVLRKLGVNTQLAAVAMLRESGWVFGITA